MNFGRTLFTFLFNLSRSRTFKLAPAKKIRFRLHNTAGTCTVYNNEQEHVQKTNPIEQKNNTGSEDMFNAKTKDAYNKYPLLDNGKTAYGNSQT